MNQKADAGNICHRIGRSHLMEVNLIRRFSVSSSFCLSNQSIHLLHILFHLFWQIQMRNHMRNPGHVRMMVMPMGMGMSMRVPAVMRVCMRASFVAVGFFMPMTVAARFMTVNLPMLMTMFMHFMAVPMNIQALFLLPVDRYLHMSAGDAAFNCFLSLHLYSRQAKPVHFFQKCLFIRAKFIQSRHQHVTGSSHTAVKINRPH